MCIEKLKYLQTIKKSPSADKFA